MFANSAAVLAATAAVVTAAPTSVSRAGSHFDEAGACSNIPLEKRTGCGNIGISPDACLSQGCCYDSSHPGTFFCFNSPGGKCREGYEGTHCDIPFREEGVNDKVSFPDYLCHKNNVFSEILVNISGQCTGNAGILFNRNESVVLSVKLTDGLNYSCEPPCPFCSVFQTIFAVDADNQYGSMSGWCASPIEYHNEDSFAGHFTVDAPDITLWLQRQPMGNYYFGLHMFDTEYCADAGFDANFNASKFTPPTFGKALWKVTKAF